LFARIKDVIANFPNRAVTARERGYDISGAKRVAVRISNSECHPHNLHQRNISRIVTDTSAF
jgi:hypothetical protein